MWKKLVGQMVFKSPKLQHNLVKLNKSSYSFRYNNMIDVLNIKTDRYGGKSFKFETAKVWNSLSNNIHTADCYTDWSRPVAGLLADASFIAG